MNAIRASLATAALLLGSAAFSIFPAQANWRGGGHSSSGGWSSTSTSSGASGSTSSSTSSSTGGSSSSGGTPVPEPADFALFGLGVVGLIIGRHGFARRKAAVTTDGAPDA